MYVNTTARYLGDPTMATGMPQPNAARLAELSPACATQWKAYRKTKRKNFPHVWRAFLAQNPSCRSGIAIRWGYQPSVAPCGDARSGLLIDCWNQALQSGLSGFSRPGTLGQSQSELDALSRWHQSVIHPGELHGLGQDDDLDLTPPDITLPPTPLSLPTDTIPLPTYTGPSYGPISPAAISATGQATYQTAPISSSVTSTSASMVSPLANLATALTKAFTPSGSAVTVNTAQQRAAGSGTSLGGMSPTILLIGGGFLLVMMMMMGMSRR
jgi:hypothetical protein